MMAVSDLKPNRIEPAAYNVPPITGLLVGLDQSFDLGFIDGIMRGSPVRVWQQMTNLNQLLSHTGIKDGGNLNDHDLGFLVHQRFKLNYHSERFVAPIDVGSLSQRQVGIARPDSHLPVIT